MSTLVGDENLATLLMSETRDFIFIHPMSTPENPAKFLQVNDYACQRLGYSREEMLCLGPLDLMDQQERAQVAEEAGRLEEERTAEFVQSLKAKGGERILCEIRARMFRRDGRKMVISIGRELTKQVRAEAALAASEKLYQVLVEFAEEGIAVAQDGRFIWVNPKMKQIFGRPRRELTARPLEEFVHPGDRDMVRERHYQRLKEQAPPAQYSFRISGAEGATVWVNISVAHIDWQGRPAALCLFTDVTEQQRMEAELQRSHKDLEMAQAIANVGNWTLDPEVGVPSWSREIYRIYERDPELGPHPLSDYPKLYSGGHWERFSRAIGQAIRHGKPYDIELFLELPSGNNKWVHAICKPDPKPGPAGHLLRGTIQDITERKRVELALSESEERFQLAMRFANDGLFDWNLTTGEIYFSPGWKRMLGYEDHEIPNEFSEWEHLTHPDDVAQSWVMLQEVLDDKRERFEKEFKMRHKDGHWVDILSRANVLRDEKGKGVRVVGTHVDISERKRAEREKARMQAELAQAQKMDALGTLSGGIAHDFNNILAAILGYSELVLEELPKDDAPVRHDLAEIVKAAVKAKKLVRQILTFSRVVEGQKRPLSINQVAQEAGAILGRTIPKMIQLGFEPQQEIWPVKADFQQMEQVLINLVSNAADAIGGQGTISVTTKNVSLEPRNCETCGEEMAGSHVLITVADNGIGMSPEAQSRIFEPFFTTKGVGKGTGLGLSTVYGIVKGHGGHICCKSREGEGTEFMIHLPALEQADSEPISEDLGGANDLGGSGTILVVDDEPSVRDVAHQMLSRSGYKVLQAASGEEALASFKERKGDIDLVLLDLGMPGMGGKACLGEVRRLDPDARVLVASGYIQYELTDELQSLGALGMVSKPYRKADILKAVNEALGS